MQVLSYARNARVALQAAAADPSCVLANVVAATFLTGDRSDEAELYLTHALEHLVQFEVPSV